MRFSSAILVSCLAISGCDLEDKSEEVDEAIDEDGVGFFVDSPVQGLSYTSTSYTGVTDQFGRFKYEEGETITFSFGNISLPTVNTSKAIHVSDLFPQGLNDTQTINLARLFLTIDNDGDYDNGVQLSADALDADNTPANLDFGSDTFDADVANYIALVASSSNSLDTLVSAEEAIDHITYSRNEVDGLLTGCGEECVPRAAYNEYVVSVSPRHAQTVDASIATLQIEFSPELTVDINAIQMEAFELPSNTENCRIDWPGLRCGDSGTESYSLTTSLTRSTKQDSNMLYIGKSVSGNTVTFSLSTSGSELASNKQYIVHIYNDQEDGFDDDYKTWWLFYTSNVQL